MHPSTRHFKYSQPCNRQMGNLNNVSTQQTKLSRATSHTHLSSLTESWANTKSFPVSESRTPITNFGDSSIADIKRSGDLAPDTTLHLIEMENLFSVRELEEILDGNVRLYREKEERIQKLQLEFNDCLHLVDAFGFDEVVFRFFAKHYVLASETWTFSQICARNALVAMHVTLMSLLKPLCRWHWLRVMRVYVICGVFWTLFLVKIMTLTQTIPQALNCLRKMKIEQEPSNYTTARWRW